MATNVIYKYPLKLTDYQKVSMPHQAQILSVQVQPGGADGIICLWALVDTDNRLVEREFGIFGTGNPIDNHIMAHIGSVQQDRFVWHIFEIFGRESV